MHPALLKFRKRFWTLSKNELLNPALMVMIRVVRGALAESAVRRLAALPRSGSERVHGVLGSRRVPHRYPYHRTRQPGNDDAGLVSP
jgi:hypothetical protein